MGVIIACCFLALFGLDRAGAKVVSRQEKEAIAQSDKEYAEAMKSFESKRDEVYKKIQAAIDKRADLTGESIAISFYDIDSKKQLELNGTAAFEAGSATKIELAMMIADKIAAGEISGSDLVYFHTADYEEGTGYLINHMEETTAIQVNKLLEYMVTYSDNIAANMLYRVMGEPSTVREYSKENYIKDLDTSGNFLTANQGIQLLQVLYANKNKNSYYDRFINWMKNSDFHERLETEKTADVLAHKVGSMNNSIHDIGIFYTGHPYMLTMFTRGTPDAEEEISSLSDEIYDLMVNEYPQRPVKK